MGYRSLKPHLNEDSKASSQAFVKKRKPESYVR